MSKKIRFLATIITTLMTAGCVTTGNPDDPLIWSRFDCQEFQPGELAQAQAVCSGRAEAASVVGTAGMPSSGPKLSNAIVDGITSGIAGARISIATGMSCMAEYGFTRQATSSARAMCAIPPGAKTAAPRVIGKVIPAPRAASPAISELPEKRQFDKSRPSPARYDEILDAY